MTGHATIARQLTEATETARTLARGVVSLARDGGMPDTFWDTDSRIALAKTVLGEDEVNRLREGDVG